MIGKKDLLLCVHVVVKPVALGRSRRFEVYLFSQSDHCFVPFVAVVIAQTPLCWNTADNRSMTSGAEEKKLITIIWGSLFSFLCERIWL